MDYVYVMTFDCLSTPLSLAPQVFVGHCLLPLVSWREEREGGEREGGGEGGRGRPGGRAEGGGGGGEGEEERGLRERRRKTGGGEGSSKGRGREGEGETFACYHIVRTLISCIQSHRMYYCIMHAITSCDVCIVHVRHAYPSAITYHIVPAITSCMPSHRTCYHIVHAITSYLL